MPRKTTAEIAFSAEQRAVEEGHRAFRIDDDHFRVISDTDSTKSYVVSWIVIGYMENLIHFQCSCPSGQHREHLPNPCKHSALVGRRCEREGWAFWHDGLFYWKESKPVKFEQPEDPWEGLPS